MISTILTLKKLNDENVKTFQLILGGIALFLNIIINGMALITRHS